MITKNQIKYIRSLHQKKYRDLNNQFIVEGEKIVNEAIKSGLEIAQIISTENGAMNIYYPDIQIVKKNEFDRLSNLKTPSQVMAVMPYFGEMSKPKPGDGVIFALDQVQDPGNLGTIIRICDWFGIKDLVCSENTVDRYNSKVIQSSMGSLFRVNIHYLDLPTYLSELSGLNLTIAGATMEGESIHDIEAIKDGIIVLGNESRGLSGEVINMVTQQITIPGYGGAESLNVAVSCGILANWVAKKS